MTSLTGKVIYQDYGDLLTTTNSGQGLSLTLEPLQDGLGHSSPIEISLNAVNFIRTGGSTFQLDGISLTSSATDINSVAKNNPILPGTGAVQIPAGTTAQRPSVPVNGDIRYNTTIGIYEGYNNAWSNLASGAIVGPNVSVAGDIPIFSDTTGQVVADSGVNISSITGPLLRSRAPNVLDVQLSNIDIVSFKDVGLIFTGIGTTEEVYVCGFHPNSISGKFPNTVFGFANPSSSDAVLELTEGAFLLSRLSQTTINALIDIDGMIVYNETTDSFNFRQNGAWISFTTGSVTSILGTANEITATGSSTVTIAIASNPVLPGTGAVKVPSGTTAQRPSGVDADFRYNTDTNLFEGYNGSWISFGTGGGSVTSITAGSNLTGGTITTTGTIALSNAPTGLTSIGVGNLEFLTNQIISTNPNGNIDLLPNGTGLVRLGAAPVTINAAGTLSASTLDASASSIDTMTTLDINVLASGGNPGLISFYDANNSNFVALRSADTVASNVIFKLPAADGTANQGIITDGSGNLSFTSLANHNAKFILQTADATLPNAQDLSALGATPILGSMIKVFDSGAIALAIAGVDYATTTELAMAVADANAAASAASTSAAIATGAAGAAAASAAAATADAVSAAASAGSITGSTSATFILQTINTNLPNAQLLSDLSSGVLQSTTGTGVLSIATQIIEQFGLQNLYVGTDAGNNTGTGISNTSLGILSANSITNGSFNTLIGNNSGNKITTGSSNVCVGRDTLANALTVGNSVGIGDEALKFSTSGNGVVAIGFQALQNNLQDGCIGIGEEALLNNTTGENIGIGQSVLSTVDVGNFNIGIGNNALLNQTGDSCIAIGQNVLTSLISQIGCIGIGTNVMTAYSAFGGGDYHVGIGHGVLGAMTSGESNVCVGGASFAFATQVTQTVGLGFETGFNQDQYTQCVLIGWEADCGNDNLTNAIAIGASATVNTSNSMVLGNNVNVGINTSSPANKLHVVGTIQQKGVTSGWTATDKIIGQNSLQTTNNTATTILTVPIPTSPAQNVSANIVLKAIKADASGASYAQSLAAAWYNGTTTAGVGALPVIAFTTGGVLVVSAAWSVSGNNLLLKVTGLAATNINWLCDYEYSGVSTSTS